MSYHRKRYSVKLCLNILLILACTSQLKAQITILQPSLDFSQACASADFNTYNLNFSFYPSFNLGASNQFIIELSDGTGSFASPTEIGSFASASSPAATAFSFPTDTSGENYQIRIRSTDPEQFSPPTNSFAAHYAVHNIPYSINNYNSPVALCNGDPFMLEVDDTGDSNSPLFYPDLNYIWYKDFIEIPGETGSSLNVYDAGSYYSIVDYGSCTMNSYSNIVQVIIPSVIYPVITFDGNNNICDSSYVTLTSALQNSQYSYQWYLDGVLVAGETNSSINATIEGIYHLIITFNGCEYESDFIALQDYEVNVSLSPSVSEVLLIPGENIPLTTTTDAASPTYEWYFNGVFIPGQNQDSIEMTDDGIYKISVITSTPCPSETEQSITTIYPDYFDLTIEKNPAYQECISNTVTLSITDFSAESYLGSVDLTSNPYGYVFEWFKDGFPIASSDAPTLTISNAAENGVYSLDIIVPDFGVVTSNSLPVNLKIDPVTIIQSSPLCDGLTTTLTSSTTDVNYNYQWFESGTPIAGATDYVFLVTSPGTYSLVVSGGTCSETSNTITIELESFDLIATSPVTIDLTPGETITLTTTNTAVSPVYQWYRNGVLMPSETSGNLSTDQEGSYELIVIQDNGCITERSIVFTLNLNTNYNLVISADASYVACETNNTILAIDTFTVSDNTSGSIDLSSNPYAYPIQWFKDGLAIPGETNLTLSLNDVLAYGNYHLEIEVPSIGFISSNTINILFELPTTTISASGPLCINDTVFINSDVIEPSYSYQWYMDGGILPSETNPNLQTNAEGNYYLVVSYPGCTVTSNTINLQYGLISIDSSNPAVDYIIPGSTIPISITSTAAIPSYQWYLDGVILVGDNQDNILAASAGTYKIIVTENDTCVVVEEREFILEYPSDYQISIAPSTTYVPCSSNSITLNIDDFYAVTNFGNIDLSTNPYNYVVQWYLDGVSISGANNNTILIDSPSKNGDYSLEITIPEYGTINSNTLPIEVTFDTIVISNDSNLCNGNTVTISSAQTDNSYSYQWYKDGSILTGEISDTLLTDQEGDYALEITAGNCVATSNIVSLSIGTINITPITSINDFILPGETKTLEISTDAVNPSYQWYHNNTLLTGEILNTLAINTDGTFMVEVTQNDTCIVVETLEFTISYPSSFQLDIAIASDYNSCDSDDTYLEMISFVAITDNGPVDITNNPYGYDLDWHINGTLIVGENNNTISINDPNQNGTYSLAISVPQYGEIYSNSIEVDLNLGSITLQSSGDLCNGNIISLSSNFTANSLTYEWFVDGTLITAETNPTIQINTPGDYQLIVSSFGCSVTSNVMPISEDSISITSNIANSYYILPGENLDIIINTSANNPSYEWFKDGSLLIGENSSELNLSTPGNYTVYVTQNSACTITDNISFNIVYPSDFLITLATDSNYQACSSDNVTLVISEIIAVTDNGNVDITTNPYNYTITWYNTNGVIGNTGNSYYLNNAGANTAYYVTIEVPGYGIINSNTVAINLSIETPVVSSSGVLCQNGTVILSAGNQPVALSSTITYQWYKDGQQISGATQFTYETGDEGEYNVEAFAGDCNAVSAPFELNYEEFLVDQLSPSQDIILPGASKNLEVSANSSAATFQWFENGILIAGEINSILTINSAGNYSVIVKDNSSCNIEITKEFNIESPLAFSFIIEMNPDYNDCSSNSATLYLVSLFATTSMGEVEVTDLSTLNYQWYWNNTIVSDETNTTITISDSTLNGLYQLELFFEDGSSIASNELEVLLSIEESMNISHDGFICENNTVTLYSSITDSSYYTFEWYQENDTTILGTLDSLEVSDAGNYWLKISYGTCSIDSPLVTVDYADPNLIIVDQDALIEILEGGSTSINASGASDYEWSLNGTIISTDSQIQISEFGVYTLSANVEDCILERDFTVSVMENKAIAIANTVTMNEDGYNDTWQIPSDYTNKENIEVIIYAASGETVLRTNNYMNNWPEADFEFSKKDAIFYYTILEDNVITKRGSITLIK